MDESGGSSTSHVQHARHDRVKAFSENVDVRDYGAKTVRYFFFSLSFLFLLLFFLFRVYTHERLSSAKDVSLSLSLTRRSGLSARYRKSIPKQSLGVRAIVCVISRFLRSIECVIHIGAIAAGTKRIQYRKYSNALACNDALYAKHKHIKPHAYPR